MAAPEALDIASEPASIQKLYGLDNPKCTHFARQCLTARRLVERGVRFVQIYSGGMENERSWDGHTDIAKNHGGFAAETDTPIAGLLADLKGRGLLDETLVICNGEFGRLPIVQKGGTGRDHNPHAFTTWMAGGGVKGGRPPRRDRRARPQGGRRPRQHQRPARHGPAPAGHRPRAADLPGPRPRLPPDRRGGQGRRIGPRLSRVAERNAGGPVSPGDLSRGEPALRSIRATDGDAQRRPRGGSISVSAAVTAPVAATVTATIAAAVTAPIAASVAVTTIRAVASCSTVGGRRCKAAATIDRGRGHETGCRYHEGRIAAVVPGPVEKPNAKPWAFAGDVPSARPPTAMTPAIAHIRQLSLHVPSFPVCFLRPRPSAGIVRSSASVFRYSQDAQSVPNGGPDSRRAAFRPHSYVKSWEKRQV